MRIFEKYEIIVVGAGHAGCEAAVTAAGMGAKTLLITSDLNTIAVMSCNPAVGGVAKGQIVREIDALGGKTGIVADESMIQFRMLNLSKGPAMWSPRSQNDRKIFHNTWVNILENTKNLDIWQDEVYHIKIENNKASGVKTKLGLEIEANSLILTNGTFLNGKIFIGTNIYHGGRLTEKPVENLTKQLNEAGFISDRMKTGTPLRIHANTIDYSKLTLQEGDKNPGKFSYSDQTQPLKKQKSCYLAYTSEKVHQIIRKGFEFSPLFKGTIEGIGPRYCPSIEDKINKFADKPRHQLFVEPEGWTSKEVYLNGFSSSLPIDIQFRALKAIEGFENAKIMRPGYAIEYDFFPPTQLKSTLETKIIENLYFAGQINGTTGYEEAAAQGLIAGINAAIKLKEQAPFILRRNEAYIGVLIDDLIVKGTDEPYRMFTSRSEYRLLLRQDNADVRLSEKAYKLGLIDNNRMKKVERKQERANELIRFLKKTSVEKKSINDLLTKKETNPITQKKPIYDILVRPQILLKDIIGCIQEVKNFVTENELSEEEMQYSEILIKYDSYFKRESELAKKFNAIEKIKLSQDIDYMKIKSISYEAREKLNKIKPHNIGQASRISGVSPADINILFILMNKNVPRGT